MSSTYTASTQGGSISPLTTKGDIYTYDTADARLPVGTDGQVLTANSAEATGLEWISLGLGTMSTQNANAVTITGGSITGITDLAVADGGTGISSATSYAVLCGGTTSTNPFQSIASVGTSGQVLTSNGAGALPTFQNATPTSGSKVLLSTQTASASANLSFTSVIDNSTYLYYEFIFFGIHPATDATDLLLTFSEDNGSSYLAAGYRYSTHYSTDTGGGTNAGSAAGSSISIALGLSNTAGKNCSGSLLYIPATSTDYISQIVSGQLSSHASTVGFRVFQPGGCNTNAVANFTGFRFAMSSGNITSGVIYMYGIVA